MRRPAASAIGDLPLPGAGAYPIPPLLRVRYTQEVAAPIQTTRGEVDAALRHGQVVERVECAEVPASWEGVEDKAFESRHTPEEERPT